MNPKKSYTELTDEELIALGNVFNYEDLGKIFNITPKTMGGKIRGAKKRYEQIEHPAQQGEEVIQAIGNIIDREKMLRKELGDENLKTIPTIGSMMTISIYTPIDIIRDEHATRKEKLTAGDHLRKCIETWNNVYKTFLETECMNETLYIIGELLKEVALPLQQLFWEKIDAHPKLKFLAKGI